jgi:hypothetical protein
MQVFHVTDTSPAAASTVVGVGLRGLGRFGSLRIDALLVGATGGVLDIYLQRQVTANVWVDWCHFVQIAAGGAAARYSLKCSMTDSTTIVAANAGTDTVPAVGLSAATFLGGHPGEGFRLVYVAGASTSAGAAVELYVTGFGEKSA